MIKKALHTKSIWKSNLLSDIRIAKEAGFGAVEMAGTKVWDYIEAGRTTETVKETLKKSPLATQFKISSATFKINNGTLIKSPTITPKIPFAISVPAADNPPWIAPMISGNSQAKQAEKGAKIEIIKIKARAGARYFLENNFFKKNILLKNYGML